VIVEQIALAAYNSSTVRTEPTRINNFINGEFIEPIGFLVIPSKVEE
jgi:hypothetical protein